MEETGITGSRLKVCTENVQGLLDKSLLLLFSPIESPSSVSKQKAHPGCEIAHVYL